MWTQKGRNGQYVLTSTRYKTKDLSLERAFVHRHYYYIFYYVYLTNSRTIFIFFMFFALSEITTTTNYRLVHRHLRTTNVNVYKTINATFILMTTNRITPFSVINIIFRLCVRGSVIEGIYVHIIWSLTWITSLECLRICIFILSVTDK